MTHKDITPATNTIKSDPTTWEIKDILLVVPAFATALAIMYDIGYFAEIDIRFFTLFSLSEHLTFAFLAAPIILVIIFGLVTGIVLAGALKSWLDQVIKPRPPIKLKRGWFWLLLIVLLSALVGVVTLLVVYCFSEQFYSPLVAFALYVILVMTSNHRTPLVAATILSGVLVFAFLWGADVSRHTRLGPATLQRIMLNDGVAEGALVRSGDRGLLLYDIAAKEYRLIRWENVKSIAAKAPSQKISN